MQLSFNVTQKEDGGDASDGQERWVIDTSWDAGERENIVNTTRG